MEQIRIVKEMRAEDERNGRAGVDVRPRYLVWENVPGALSSNRGGDFRTVLEEIARVKDENAVIPEPPKGKWTSCGCILGDGYSIAWRILDAQFWGVPQRRRRIALVADFGGASAPEVLFVRKSLQGHTDEGKQKRKGVATDAEGGTLTDDCKRNEVLCYDIGEARLRTPSEYTDVSPTISARCGTGGNNTPAVVTFEPGIASREGGHVYENVSGTLRANAGDNQMSVVYSKSKRAQSETDYETWKESDTANTLNGFDTGDVRASEVVLCVDQGGGKSGVDVREGQAPTLTTPHDGAPAVVYAMDRASFNQGKNAQFDFEVNDSGVCPTVVAKGPGAVAYASDGDVAGTLDASYYKGCGTRNGRERTFVVEKAYGFDPSADRDVGKYFLEDCGNTLFNGTCPGHKNGVLVKAKTRYIVRRLTPLECERLQGYPDGWTDIGEWTDSKGKVHKTSDAQRYKALGNSIALPQWKWVLKRICANYERDATMASLFDGIGGFPYLWEQLNGKGSCLWASEIEEFPMAVTKVRIGE
jgi:DNA (cytosine-5)-methyltransferase 1